MLICWSLSETAVVKSELLDMNQPLSEPAFSECVVPFHEEATTTTTTEWLLRNTHKAVRECCIYVFTETWLNNNILDHIIQLEWLTCYRADRALIEGRGGRTHDHLHQQCLVL